MFFEIALQCLLITLTYSFSQHPILIIVSYDAFRYDYLSPEITPNLLKLRQEGSYADYVINVFPTKTFPNHHSIATGLYPEVHGVIGNMFLEPQTNKIVNMSYELYHYNEEIVPIWRRNEDSQDGRYSGSMMWPGASYSYQNKNITYNQPYAPGMGWHKRIDKVIEWIKDPVKPANLVMVYFEEPDTHGHAYGPNSEVVRDLLKELDNITNYLDQQLQINNLSDKTHVVHLSDHGMVGVAPPKFINCSQYLQPDTYILTGVTPILQITPKQGFETEVYKNLKRGAKKNGHFKVYKKSEYLPRWHYRDNPRSPALLVLADIGYGLDDMFSSSQNYAKKYNFNVTEQWEFGVHGYDYAEPEMRPIFMARGPRIQKNHQVAPFNTVDLFDFFCDILEIPTLPNNGTGSIVKDMLVNHGGKYSLSTIFIITAGGILIAFVLISCAALITLIMIKRQQSITTTAALNKRFPQTFQTSVEAQHLLEPEEA